MFLYLSVGVRWYFYPFLPREHPGGQENWTSEASLEAPFQMGSLVRTFSWLPGHSAGAAEL